MDKQTPNIFQYADYRQFIKDLIETKKSMNAKYSYRYYSARAGFSSSNFISMVVKGKRNLTSASIGKLAKGLGLNKQERSFFEDLVFMNQATTHEEKDHYYQRMLSARPYANLKKLDKSSYEYFFTRNVSLGMGVMGLQERHEHEISFSGFEDKDTQTVNRLTTMLSFKLYF